MGEPVRVRVVPDRAPIRTEPLARADLPADVAADPIAPDTSARARPRRRVRNMALLLLLPTILVAGGLYLWLTAGRFVSTDNAYVRQDKVSVGAEINGRIVAVAVRENRHVERGDLLFVIDPEPYRIAIEQARAAIADAQVKVTSLRSSYRAKGADIDGARVAIQTAQEDMDRQSGLMGRGFTTRARYQQAEQALKQARVQLANAQSAAEEAHAKLATGAAVPGINPGIAAARAQLHQALLNLSRTQVRAPVSGTVSQADRLQVGQMMITALPAVSIVVNGQSWIEANFKETDLDRMRVGQRATIGFDAYPELKLAGHVASIGAGTGSEFSVLPAQNANGNWVKVTQRVPVRIAVDTPSPRTLIAGLSASVEVDVRDAR